MIIDPRDTPLECFVAIGFGRVLCSGATPEECERKVLADKRLTWRFGSELENKVEIKGAVTVVGTLRNF